MRQVVETTVPPLLASRIGVIPDDLKIWASERTVLRHSVGGALAVFRADKADLATSVRHRRLLVVTTYALATGSDRIDQIIDRIPTDHIIRKLSTLGFADLPRYFRTVSHNQTAIAHCLAVVMQGLWIRRFGPITANPHTILLSTLIQQKLENAWKIFFLSEASTRVRRAIEFTEF